MYFAIIMANYNFFSVFAMFVISQRLIKVVIKNTLQLLFVTTLHQRLRFPKEGYHRTFIQTWQTHAPIKKLFVFPWSSFSFPQNLSCTLCTTWLEDSWLSLTSLQLLGWIIFYLEYLIFLNAHLSLVDWLYAFFCVKQGTKYWARLFQTMNWTFLAHFIHFLDYKMTILSLMISSIPYY